MDTSCDCPTPIVSDAMQRAQDGIWTTKDGTRLSVRLMDMAHLENCLRLVVNGTEISMDPEVRRTWIDVLFQEIYRRMTG